MALKGLILNHLESIYRYRYRYRFYTECYRSFHQITILKPKLAATCTPWLTLSYRLGGNCRLHRLWHWLFRGRSTSGASSTFVPVFRDLVRAIKVSVLCLQFLGQMATENEHIAGNTEASDLVHSKAPERFWLYHLQDQHVFPAVPRQLQCLQRPCRSSHLQHHSLHLVQGRKFTASAHENL